MSVDHLIRARDAAVAELQRLEHQLDVKLPKRIQEVRADVELLDRAVTALQTPIDAEPVAARYIDGVVNDQVAR